MTGFGTPTSEPCVSTRIEAGISLIVSLRVIIDAKPLATDIVASVTMNGGIPMQVTKPVKRSRRGGTTNRSQATRE